MGFRRGDQVVWRSRPQGAVGTVIAAIVVEDRSDRIVLFQPAGSPKVQRVGRRGGPGGRLLLPDGWDGEYEVSAWRGPSTARLYPMGASFVVYRNWNPGSGEYEGWYVNLESPWERTAIGFDGLDHVLDVRVADDLSSWSWKDEDELAWSVEMGKMTAAEADAARAEGERAISLIESRAWPFSADWSAWAPDPAWDLPTLPSTWAHG